MAISLGIYPIFRQTHLVVNFPNGGELVKKWMVTKLWMFKNNLKWMVNWMVTTQLCKSGPSRTPMVWFLARLQATKLECSLLSCFLLTWTWCRFLGTPLTGSILGLACWPAAEILLLLGSLWFWTIMLIVELVENEVWLHWILFTTPQVS